MAIRAATRNVLSPISEKRIMVKERKNEWRGCISPFASVGFVPCGELFESTFRGSSFEEPGGDGCGMSCGFSGRSSGF